MLLLLLLVLLLLQALGNGGEEVRDEKGRVGKGEKAGFAVELTTDEEGLEMLTGAVVFVYEDLSCGGGFEAGGGREGRRRRGGRGKDVFENVYSYFCGELEDMRLL